VTRTLLDRRRPTRSDQRRAALLEALDAMLHEHSLDEINVADIADRVGVSRSAFYFYFENKAAAVAALSAQLYDEVSSTTTDLFALTGTPRARFEGQMRGLVEVWHKHQHLYGAMLEARQTNPAVREMWDEGRLSFLPAVVAMIDAERASGNAPAGPDATALATVLLELNDIALERIARGDPLPIEDRIEALITMWQRAIYGTET
jgi:AcrR family transcriptional regulator